MDVGKVMDATMNSPVIIDYPELLLESLRWKEDMLITNDFDERVWLKPLFNSANERIGITDCCFENAPCEWHRSIENAKRQQRMFT